MALFDTARPVVATYTVGARFTHSVSVVFGKLKAWNDTRTTRNALAQLSDHELEDIGISRGQFDRIS